jgi:hypothetical protein
MYTRRASLEAILHFEVLGMSQALRNAKWQKDQCFSCIKTRDLIKIRKS